MVNAVGVRSRDPNDRIYEEILGSLTGPIQGIKDSGESALGGTDCYVSHKPVDPTFINLMKGKTPELAAQDARVKSMERPDSTADSMLYTTAGVQAPIAAVAIGNACWAKTAITASFGTVTFSFIGILAGLFAWNNVWSDYGFAEEINGNKGVKAAADECKECLKDKLPPSGVNLEGIFRSGDKNEVDKLVNNGLIDESTGKTIKDKLDAFKTAKEKANKDANRNFWCTSIGTGVGAGVAIGLGTFSLLTGGMGIVIAAGIVGICAGIGCLANHLVKKGSLDSVCEFFGH